MSAFDERVATYRERLLSDGLDERVVKNRLNELLREIKLEEDKMKEASPFSDEEFTQLLLQETKEKKLALASAYKSTIQIQNTKLPTIKRDTRVSLLGWLLRVPSGIILVHPFVTFVAVGIVAAFFKRLFGLSWTGYIVIAVITFLVVAVMNAAGKSMIEEVEKRHK